MAQLIGKYFLASFVFFCLQCLLCDADAQQRVKSVAMQEQYVCLPCGADCDNTVSTTPGNCEHCHMQLVKKSSIIFKNISPAKLCDEVTKMPSIVLLDVRTPEEFNGKADVKYGRLKNAINIPIQQLQSRLAELKQYKNREIIVYCSHSHRSPRASYLLTQNGFKHVTNMQGGMSVWNEQVTDKACSASIYVAQ
jgi:rhodanese-related sulfurtransferase/DNA-directed RNA polymerase subunit RPC12/RpoP